MVPYLQILEELTQMSTEIQSNKKLQDMLDSLESYHKKSLQNYASSQDKLQKAEQMIMGLKENSKILEN